jgi:hypothetical protein
VKTLIRCAVAAVALAVSPLALGGLGPNGLGPNGLGPNGLGPNGLGPNGLGPNGLGPNGLGPNGLDVNGLGPNGLGPNGLDVNGLGPNGLGPNGLGPNGLGITALYAITPDGWATNQPSAFKQWFESDPTNAAQYMKYFARCSYDSKTAIAYLDSHGFTWLWTGQYGLAMASLKTTIEEPGLGLIRGRMTQDEGKWVSACVLAHVNIKGTHQYISLRANPPNPEAQAAFKPTPGERWVMQGLGIFFGDLYAPNPKKYSAAYTDFAVPPPMPWIEAALGRDCEIAACTYVDKLGVVQDVLTYHMNSWVFHGQNLGIYTLQATRTDPDYEFDTVTQIPSLQAEWKGDVPTVDYHPIFTLLPFFYDFEGASQPNALGTGTINRGAPIAPAQVVHCAQGECMGFMNGQGGATLVGLTGGQVVDTVHSFPLRFQNTVSSAIEPLVPDMDEAFTALIRYSNGRPTTDVLEVLTSQKDGSMRSFGAEIWPGTGAANQYTWLYVYPVYPFADSLDNGGNPSLRVRVAAAAQGEACTGSKLKKGDGETGTCSNLKYTYFDWKHPKVACREAGESQPICRGEMILDYRKGKWGWFCDYGGKALFACTAADAPVLDAAGFVPGKPFCAPSGATSFAGVCN